MTILIQAIELVIAIVIMVLVAKWQVDDDIKKMDKRLDEFNKELDEEAKVTGNKENITYGILLRAGFHKKETDSIIKIRCPEYYSIELPGFFIELYNISNTGTRSWSAKVINSERLYMADIDIQTIGHFNKLMEILDVNFMLKEE